MLNGLQLAALASLLTILARPAAAEIPTIRPFAEIGPWPVVSQLIGFQGRVWFVNSTKGVNHNSADVYSISRADLSIRFERALFSQDAGDPVVSDGKLYWPLEDSRNSVGWAEVTLTDGRDWRRIAIPTAQAFHAHAMAAWHGELIAATSAWRAGLQASSDKSISWRRLYDHPTPNSRVSRLVKLAAADDFFLGHLIDVGRHRVLRGDGKGVSVLDGWPEGLDVAALAGKGTAVYLAADLPEGIGLWRSDGTALEKLEVRLPEGWVQDFRATARRLWLLTAQDGSGAVWSSADEGRTWREELRLRGGTPWDLHVEGTAIYVGGKADSGRGALWAQRADTGAVLDTEQAGALLEARPSVDLDWGLAAARLDSLLAQPESYVTRSTLRDEIYRLAMAGPPANFFAERLLRSGNPAGELSLIGGRVRVANRDFADWLLLWGMGLSGQPGVPVSFLLKPWSSPSNPAEKYFEPAPAALWAVVMGEQADPVTISALIERLGFEDDPDWLRNQVAGTLASLTGRRKILDQVSWLQWWGAAESGWKTRADHH